MSILPPTSYPSKKIPHLPDGFDQLVLLSPFLRTPRKGERLFGLSRTKIYNLISGSNPAVASVSVHSHSSNRNERATRGSRLIITLSLLNYLLRNGEHKGGSELYIKQLLQNLGETPAQPTPSEAVLPAEIPVHDPSLWFIPSNACEDDDLTDEELSELVQWENAMDEMMYGSD